jgi:hypothetical protein
VTATPSDISSKFWKLLDEIRDSLTEEVGGFPELTYTLDMTYFTLRMPSRFLKDAIDTSLFKVSHDTTSGYVTIDYPEEEH